MCNIGAVTHWCFDCINKCHLSYFIYMPPIGHMDWIGFGLACTSSLWIGLDWVIELMDWIGLDLENWTHVQLCAQLAYSNRSDGRMHFIKYFPMIFMMTMMMMMMMMNASVNQSMNEWTFVVVSNIMVDFSSTARAAAISLRHRSLFTS